MGQDKNHYVARQAIHIVYLLQIEKKMKEMESNGNLWKTMESRINESHGKAFSCSFVAYQNQGKYTLPVAIRLQK